MQTPEPQPSWRRPPSKVLVVLPAYNEEQSLGILLERIDQTMFESGIDYQVVVVDDGSQDATLSIAQRYADEMPIHVERHEVNQGLGRTIGDGLKAATSMCGEHDIVVAMDADNTHTPRLIPAMVQLVHEGNDVVIASRYQRGARVCGVPFHRELLSSAARLLFRVAFPIRGVRDYTCGYRAYRASVLRRAFETMGDGFVSEEGFQCMVDILLKLRRLDVLFREVPLILRYDLKGGVSKMKVGQTIIRTLGLMLRRRFGR